MLCRTRAGAQDRLRARDADVVWTIGDLFERLATWATLVTGARRDDVVARVRAAHLLARGTPDDAPADSLAGDAAADSHGGRDDVTRRARVAIRPRLAPALDALRRELVHAQTSAAELADATGAFDDDGNGQGRRAEVRRLLGWAAATDAALARDGVVDEATALARARDLLRAGRRPGFLKGVGAVHVDLPVEATALQAAALQALARHVDVVVVLPVDTVPGRHALDGVDDVFRAFERDADGGRLTVRPVDVAGDGPLAPLRHALFGDGVVDGAVAQAAAVRLLPDQHAELAFVAGAVAARRLAEPGCRVAVAARGEDALDAVIAALERQGLPVRRRRRRLLDSPAARLLIDVVTLQLDGAPRERLLAALVSVARRGGSTGAQGAAVLATLRRAAARRDVEDATRPTGSYRHRLERLALRDPTARAAVAEALAAIEPLLAATARLAPLAPLGDQLHALLGVIDELVEQRGRFGGAELREVVARLRAGVERAGVVPARDNAAGHDDDQRHDEIPEHEDDHERDGEAPVDLHATLQLVSGELAAQPWLEDDTEAADDAIEVLTLPELAGRTFDHLVVVGAVEGELPRLSSSSVLLGDHDRAALNRALGRRALRLADDTGVSAGRGRGTGLEGAWWLLGLRSARRSLLVTASSRDGRARERAPSAWALDLARALGRDPEVLLAHGAAGGRVAVVEPPRARRVARARALRAAGDRRAAGDAPQGDAAFADAALADAALADAALADAVALYGRMADERARFFAAAPRVEHERVDEPSAWAARRAPFAFAVDGKRVARVFGASFGLRPERPLTPTRLEALAECRLHGFVQHVLKLDVEPEPGHSLEARAAGHLAHDALERFFRERRARRIPFARMNAEDRARLAALVDERAAPLLAGEGTGHLPTLAASVGYLKATLVRVVTQLARRPPLDDVEPAAFEMQIGATQGGRPPELGSVPVQVAPGRTLWLGGIIDRVDEGPGGRAVVDYKTMTGARVRTKAGKAALLRSHFQLLVYLRLLEHHRPTGPTTLLHGYLVSLKDGTTSADVGELPDLRGLVVDDERPDGLGRAIGRVVLPILDGTLPPDAGVRCADCRLLRVCRVPQEVAIDSQFDGQADDHAGAAATGEP
ncbi:MAG: hypothetical protein FJ137_09780 [Deltaproteobacteria bacterium]|nr:hypothetical protein [Deltaproteobacteria bacterium]